MKEKGPREEGAARFCPRILRLGPPVTGSAWPSASEMPKKSQKGLPGPVGPECQKSAEKVEKVSEKSLPLALFRDFFRLSADRPETTFLRCFLAFLAQRARHSL